MAKRLLAKRRRTVYDPCTCIGGNCSKSTKCRILQHSIQLGLLTLAILYCQLICIIFLKYIQNEWGWCILPHIILYMVKLVEVILLENYSIYGYSNRELFKYRDILNNVIPYRGQISKSIFCYRRDLIQSYFDREIFTYRRISQIRYSSILFIENSSIRLYI